LFLVDNDHHKLRIGCADASPRFAMAITLLFLHEHSNTRHHTIASQALMA
jgi:hypothetical protein